MALGKLQNLHPRFKSGRRLQLLLSKGENRPMDHVRIENLLNPSSHEHRRRSSMPKNALIGVGMTCTSCSARQQPCIPSPPRPRSRRASRCFSATPPPGPSPGRSINVPAGGDLQTALNDAGPGDTILLEAGATSSRGTSSCPSSPGMATSRSDRRRRTRHSRRAMLDITPLVRRAVTEIEIGEHRAGTRDRGRRTPLPAPLHRVPGQHKRGGRHHRARRRLMGAKHARVGAARAHCGPVYIHGDAVAGQKRGIALNSAATSVLNSLHRRDQGGRARTRRPLAGGTARAVCHREQLPRSRG